MFDNPKKELERLQAQLLAVNEPEAEAFEDPSDDIYDEFEDEDEAYDAELEAILSGTDLRPRRRDAGEDISPRAAGFDADDYEMDTGRYVPAPKKRGIGCLAAFGLFQAVAVIALIAWLLRELL